MPQKLGNAALVRRLREAMGELEPNHNGMYFYACMMGDGGLNEGTIRRVERGEQGCYPAAFEGMAVGFSTQFIELYDDHEDHHLFNYLKTPDLGWLIVRLKNKDPMPIKPEDLIVNHEDRYLVEDYRVRLAVRPSLNSRVPIPRAGQETESFLYHDIATVTYDVRFSKHNQREEPGFRLAYGTHNGRISLLEPWEEQLVEDKAYRLHKRNAMFEPVPRAGTSHRLRLAVYGGYDTDNEAAHFSVAQPAYYQNISFTIDLSAYPDSAIKEHPKLIMVPVLSDRKLDCCDIARKGEGFPVDPDGFGLQLLPSLTDMGGLTPEGKRLVVVALVNGVLHVRIFGEDGLLAVNTEEKYLKTQASQIEDLKKQVRTLRIPHEITRSRKELIIATVASIVGYTVPSLHHNGEWNWSFSGRMDEMLCVRWKIDHSQIGEAGVLPHETMCKFLNKI